MAGGLDPDGMPRWASRTRRRAIRIRWTNRETAIAIGLLVLVAGLIGFGRATSASAFFSVLLGCATVGFGVSCLLAYRRSLEELQSHFDESERLNELLFERTGIALWREDWSAVRDAVLKLLRVGVKDIQAHFAAHPDELRELRQSVIIKDVNHFAVHRLGARSKNDLLGPLDSILPDTDPTFVQWLIGFARGDTLYSSETHLTAADGSSKYTLFAAGLPLNMEDFENIVVSDLDITDYKVTQAKLAQAQIDLARAARISTMGALSASIAHEVNSPLAAIIANAEATLRWLRRDEPELSEALVGVQQIVEAATMAKRVVEGTRTFLSNAAIDMRPHRLKGLIQEAVRLLDRELRALGVAVHVDAPDSLPMVQADAINIQQVLINLVLNAAQAMEAVATPRDVTIRARQDGPRLRVQVSDKGIGINPETMKRIFEPFYSTKIGGIGMGLAICRTCIAAHGGRLWATSTVGEGSTFHFDLPISSVSDDARNAG